MDIASYNRQAWDKAVEKNNKWTQVVSKEVIEQARSGKFEILLTPLKPIPSDWLGDVRGKTVLCLASGGGQQTPILAAAGAKVTVLDNSPNQLAQDQKVADREGLTITTVLGDMRDLSMFENNHFDLIVHPCSNSFIPNVEPVWQECSRVLKTGGHLLSGFINPCFYIFDYDSTVKGPLEVRHKLPYSDQSHLTEQELIQLTHDQEPLMFSHSLEALIQGQIDSGLIVTGLYEDTWNEGVLSEYLPTFIATKSTKLAR